MLLLILLLAGVFASAQKEDPRFDDLIRKMDSAYAKYPGSIGVVVADSVYSYRYMNDLLEHFQPDSFGVVTEPGEVLRIVTAKSSPSKFQRLILLQGGKKFRKKQKSLKLAPLPPMENWGS